MTLNYHRFGSGDRFLLAVHGFADRGELFFKIRDALENKFTVITVDLPFHGMTDWPKNEFNPKDLQKAFLEIFEKEGIVENFSVICHSMGARIILSISEFFENRIDSYIMLSPAGFQGALSDSPVLFPKFLRKVLKLMTTFPMIILFIFKFGKFVGIINRGTYNFLEKQIVLPERRKRLFNCWISLYHFPIDLMTFKKRVIKNKSKLNFFYGDKDYITPAKYGKKFIADLPDAKLYMVDDGHYFLRESLGKCLKMADL